MAYDQVWALDFEFTAPPGHRPTPVCMCAEEVLSGARLRLWGDELRTCPFRTDDKVLFVSFFASAEIGCFMALGWPLPALVLDLYAEFRVVTNGRTLPAGRGLLGALVYYGLAGMAAAEKDRLRKLIMTGGPFSEADRAEILTYCDADVTSLVSLLEAMQAAIAVPAIRFQQAIIRGHYSRVVAAMEHAGIPIDVPLLDALKANWTAIKARLIDEVDPEFGVFEDGHFRERRFGEMIAQRRYAWPTLPSGRLELSAEAFKQMSTLYPELGPLRQLRNTLGELKLNDLAVGPDGRNRVLLSPFGTITGRNAPSSSRFVFGPATWARFLIKPTKGRAVAYLDWSSQEIGIAAALSGDERLIEAVRSGDPYLAFAITAGLAPADASKLSHYLIRDMIKASVLAIGYGMQAPALAFRLGISTTEAQYLLQRYDETYPRFAKWRQEHLDRSLLGFTPSTVFGWCFEVGDDTKVNTLKNFPIQSTGAEMLRAACGLAAEQEVEVCAPLHDALMVEDDDGEPIEAAVELTAAAMREASRIILGGLEIRVDTKIFRYPDRFFDARGEDMFNRITKLLTTSHSNATADCGEPSDISFLMHAGHRGHRGHPIPPSDT